MPVVRATRQTTGLEAMSKALGATLDSIQQLKALRGRQMMQDAVLKALETGGSVPQAITRTRSGDRKGPTGFGPLDAILGAFDPNKPIFPGPTPVEDLLTGNALQSYQKLMGEKAEKEAGVGRYHVSPAEKSRKAYYDYQLEAAKGASPISLTQSEVRSLAKEAQELDLVVKDMSQYSPEQQVVIMNRLDDIRRLLRHAHSGGRGASQSAPAEPAGAAVEAVEQAPGAEGKPGHIYINPDTGEKIITFDGGATWHAIQ